MVDLPPEAGPVLCEVARRAIRARLGVANADFHTAVEANGAVSDGSTPPGYENSHHWLDTPGAAFVTLTQDGALRGCIGSLAAHRPLRDDVAANAVNAAIRDPRFPPLTVGELPRTRIEVSVLGTPEPFPYRDLTDALARLRPGVDGLILEYGTHRGTFLPQVWEQLPQPADFVARLVRKAGLPEGWWDNEARLSRYTVTAFEEP